MLKAPEGSCGTLVKAILATPAITRPDPEHPSENSMGTQHLVKGAQHDTD